MISLSIRKFMDSGSSPSPPLLVSFFQLGIFFFFFFFFGYIRTEALQYFDQNILRFTFSSFTTPDLTMEYNLETKTKKVIKKKEVLGGFKSENYVSKVNYPIFPCPPSPFFFLSFLPSFFSFFSFFLFSFFFFLFLILPTTYEIEDLCCLS